jgi:brefeldin A-inhibited guanine nucleotide-exchange protein
LAPEIKLRRQSLECLVAALKSLVTWSTVTSSRNADEPRQSIDGLGRQQDGSISGSTSNLDAAQPTATWPADHSIRQSISGFNTPDVGDDDVERFESAKQRKNTLQEGIKKFNFKPKRGIEYLVQHGFIKSKSPQDIARFLLGNEGLSKAMIGEYLGEG